MANYTLVKHFDKELVMTKKTMKILRTLLNVGFDIMIILMNLKLNHKIPVVLRNLKNYDSHLIMQELGKFNLKINAIPNGLEKYMSFTINNKLILIDSFEFLSSLSGSLV